MSDLETHEIPAAGDPETWRLCVPGAVGQPLRLSPVDLETANRSPSNTAVRPVSSRPVPVESAGRASSGEDRGRRNAVFGGNTAAKRALSRLE